MTETKLPAKPPEDEISGKVRDLRLLGRLLPYARPYRGRAAGAAALMLLSAGLQLVGPLASAVALDLFVRPARAAPGTAAAGAPALSQAGRLVRAAMVARGIEPAHVQPQGLAVCALVFVAAVALAALTLQFQGRLLQVMGQLILRDLRNAAFSYLQELPLAFFDRQPVGRLVTRVTADVDALSDLFAAGLVELTGDVLLLAGIAAVLLWLDWRLVLAEMTLIPLLALLTLGFRRAVRQSFRQARQRFAALGAFLQEHITGMTVVQLFGREAAAHRELVAINGLHRAADLRSIVYFAAFDPAVELVAALGLGLLILVGGGQVARGALSLGALIAFLQYAQRAAQPLSSLAEKFNLLQNAMAGAERVFGLLDTPATVASPPAPFAPSRLRGEVELAAVRFGYLPGEPVLHDVSFRVAPGETLAIVGPTGAGKSTLANLLLRFYDVEAGAVKVDGVDVREWSLPALRRGIGLMLQDTPLFSGTVAANIRLGEPAIDEARVRWAAGEAQALAFIERLPRGFDTVVGERGAGLSVGQKQLIAFARALAFDPRILILDEATASIDTQTEQLIQQALARLLHGRTSLVIAHRLSTVQRADRVLVLHQGVVREIGTHQQLLARRGIYHRLHQLQFRQERLIAADPTPASTQQPGHP